MIKRSLTNRMSQDSSSPSRAAWLAVGLLWPVALLNYLDRQMLSTMGLSIKADIIELQSAEKYGQLMAIFMWVYALCSPLGGLIADRVSKRWLIITSLGVWSFVTLMMGHVHGYNELYWLRAVMGVSEAFYIPAGLALIADFHRGATRSLAVGIHMSGIYLGQALGGLGGWVAQEISWRAAFQGCGYIGVAYAFVLIALLRERERESLPVSQTTESMQGDGKVSWAGFVILMLCFSLPSLPGWAVKNWLPTLLQDRFLMEQKTSGLWATVVVDKVHTPTCAPSFAAAQAASHPAWPAPTTMTSKSLFTATYRHRTARTRAPEDRRSSAGHTDRPTRGSPRPCRRARTLPPSRRPALRAPQPQTPAMLWLAPAPGCA